MLFNSIEFAVFLLSVFPIYWLVNDKVKLQNSLVLLASYVFYGWWDWRFLLLIAFSTVVDYTCGILIVERKKPLLFLYLSIAINLGVLAYFKYANFFTESFATAFSQIGIHLHHSTLSIILPVGISFYTFQTLSYSIDVYREKISPTRDFIAFAAFVSFFPQLVAGPIERASHLLPQFYSKRNFNYLQATNGLKQILWGLFKKMVIADNCATYADLIFDNPAQQQGSTLMLGVLFFSFQIYGDFSGYSDIAIGVSRLFGFDLMQNFAFPYFSRNMAEFWKKWHISLSTWFRDYVYIPLGGSKISLLITLRNTCVVFVLSGLWHGANSTYIVWGIYHALCFIPLLFIKNKSNYSKTITYKDLPLILITFSLTSFGWIFFRSPDIHQAFAYLSGIFSPSIFQLPQLPFDALITLALMALFICIEWVGREGKFGVELLFQSCNQLVRWSFYALLILIMGLYAQTEVTPFIYFQF